MNQIDLSECTMQAMYWEAKQEELKVDAIYQGQQNRCAKEKPKAHSVKGGATKSFGKDK